MISTRPLMIIVTLLEECRYNEFRFCFPLGGLTRCPGLQTWLTEPLSSSVLHTGDLSWCVVGRFRCSQALSAEVSAVYFGTACPLVPRESTRSFLVWCTLATAEVSASFHKSNDWEHHLSVRPFVCKNPVSDRSVPEIPCGR